jgi:TrmH family RNA methyltransferase
MTAKLIKIYSQNNDYQYIETLRRNREKRHQGGEFFLEGVRPINQALRYHWRITAFVYARDKELSGWARDILRASRAARHYEMPPTLLQELSNKEETSELMALAEIPTDDTARIPLAPQFTVLVFDRPSSPGNLGSIIRSCDALGAQGIIVTGHGVDVYSPEVISASTGSFFAVPVVRKPSAQALLPWIAAIRAQLGDLRIVGTDEHGKTDIAHHDFTRPTMLLVGNETWGLSNAYRELCDVMARIPMVGSASSLNAACATSIVLYEIARQRTSV